MTDTKNKARAASVHAQGEARQASDELEAKLGEKLDQLRAWTIERPITAIILTACITFVLGARWASEWHRKNSAGS